MTSRLNPAKQSTKNMRKIRKKKGMPLKKVVDPRDAVASKGLMQRKPDYARRSTPQSKDKEEPVDFILNAIEMLREEKNV